VTTNTAFERQFRQCRDVDHGLHFRACLDGGVWQNEEYNCTLPSVRPQLPDMREYQWALQANTRTDQANLPFYTEIYSSSATLAWSKLLAFTPTSDFRLKRVVIPLIFGASIRDAEDVTHPPSSVSVTVVGVTGGSIDMTKQWGRLLPADDEFNHQISRRPHSFSYVGDILLPQGETVILRVCCAPFGVRWLQPLPHQTNTQGGAAFESRIGYIFFFIGLNLDS
jgi:hypothetical protein